MWPIWKYQIIFDNSHIKYDLNELSELSGQVHLQHPSSSAKWQRGKEGNLGVKHKF